MPGGVIFFAEVKTTGEKPSPLQRLTHAKIKRLGFKVFIIDCTQDINTILKSYE